MHAFSDVSNFLKSPTRLEAGRWEILQSCVIIQDLHSYIWGTYPLCFNWTVLAAQLADPASICSSQRGRLGSPSRQLWSLCPYNASTSLPPESALSSDRRYHLSNKSLNMCHGEFMPSVIFMCPFQQLVGKRCVSGTQEGRMLPLKCSFCGCALKGKYNGDFALH